MAGGMLSGLFTPQPRDLRLEELDEQKRIDTLAADPFKALASTAISSSRDAGRGLGTAIAAGMGRDPRTPGQRHTEAVEAAKAEAAKLGLDPDDPNSIDQFYKQVIMILQKQGLVAEALEVGKEYAAQKGKRTKEGLEVRELQRREARDKRAAELGILRIASAEEIARARNATAKDIATAKLTAEQLKTGPFRTVDYGDHIEILNRHNEVVSSKPKGPAPMNEKDTAKNEGAKKAAESAYAEYAAGLQRQYNAVADLYNHPGVEGITGRIGRLVGTEGAAGETATTLASADARAAIALHEQVQGGAFLAGLAKLKAASKTGATGLGAVSEREGDKVQADAAALNRAQNAKDYRAQLAIYAKAIEGFGTRLTDAATADGIAPQPLAPKPLTGPGKGAKPAPAAPVPAPAPSPAAAPKPAGSAGGKFRRDPTTGKIVRER